MVKDSFQDFTRSLARRSCHVMNGWNGFPVSLETHKKLVTEFKLINSLFHLFYNDMVHILLVFNDINFLDR